MRCSFQWRYFDDIYRSEDDSRRKSKSSPLFSEKKIEMAVELGSNSDGSPIVIRALQSVRGAMTILKYDHIYRVKLQCQTNLSVTTK
jgi:hypothetical protein